MMKFALFLFASLSLLAVVAMADFDLGDLPECYPTFYGNPAHTMSNKAWLGECVTPDSTPHYGDLDDCDDGVEYLDPPWFPCTFAQVSVTVTTGPNYNGQQLYLSGWKDGNFDGDFCDVLCQEQADEWIVQDEPVSAGTTTLGFIDPGVLDIGVYPGVFRWRLTDRPFGREGFGMWNHILCEESPVCGVEAADSLGEVEDYWIEDFQLLVTMSGFEAVPGDSKVTLNWRTASEIANDHFEILRDGTPVQTVSSKGNTGTGNSYSWTDTGLLNGTAYNYTLVAVDVVNHHQEAGTANATPQAGAGTVEDYALEQNYPNPFNPSTSITFNVAATGDVSLRVFNMIGQEVAILMNGPVAQGRHSVTLDASHLPSGLYVYRLEADGFTAQKKMLLMK